MLTNEVADKPLPLLSLATSGKGLPLVTVIAFESSVVRAQVESFRKVTMIALGFLQRPLPIAPTGRTIEEVFIGTITSFASWSQLVLPAVPLLTAQPMANVAVASFA